MPDLTVCSACREMAENRAWVLRSLGHPECVAALRDERLAAMRFWIRINPQGCVVGSVYASALDEDSTQGAHAEFVPDRPTRLYEAAHGWKHERVTRAEWKRRAEPCLSGDCDHHVRAAS
jgi:hypothetical protein